MPIQRNSITFPVMAISVLFILQVTALFALEQERSPDEARVVVKIEEARGYVTKDGAGRVDSIFLTRVTDAQVEAIDFSVFSRLESVGIRWSKITKPSLIHLRKIPPGLLTLELTGMPLDEIELALLLRRQKSLESLKLRYTSITDKTLAEIGKLENLGGLELGNTKVTDNGLKSLANLQNLIILNLSNTDISDAGLRELKNLSGLGILDLSGTKITDAGIQELANLEFLGSLQVYRTKVTEKGKNDLKKKQPDLSFF